MEILLALVGVPLFALGVATYVAMFIVALFLVDAKNRSAGWVLGVAVFGLVGILPGLVFLFGLGACPSRQPYRHPSMATVPAT